MLVGDSVSRSTSLAGRTGPLSGIKVLELAQIMAGPTCGMMLADMGADVIKVEKLPGGDDSRGYKEPLLNGVSAPFLVLNRNKRGIALNLKLESAKEVLKRMVAGSDVLTENYRKGTLEKLGLGYDVLSDINPRLIYCAVSGYGRSGPKTVLGTTPSKAFAAAAPAPREVVDSFVEAYRKNAG
ncbi:MAG: CoA transferase, partial [Burkholderiaceae bacterium]